jgi:hypothetical protein
VIHHRGSASAVAGHPKLTPGQVSVADFTFEEVCKKGNTLIWDLVQDDMAVSTVLANSHFPPRT